MGLKRSFTRKRKRDKAVKKFINSEYLNKDIKSFSAGFNSGWKKAIKWFKKRANIE